MMAEDSKEKKEGTEETKLSFKTADELTQFLMDIQGQIVNMQETIDKLSPVEEKAEGSEGVEGSEGKEEELSDEEINEIDRLLQSE